MMEAFGMRWTIAAWLSALVLAAASAQADFQSGQAAWDAGLHAEAVTAWQEAARGNDGRAMLALGRAYVKGLGVPQDYVEAHKWLNLAAGLGAADAAVERDALAAEMTGNERAEARRLARAWRSEATPPATDVEPQATVQAPTTPPSSVGAPPERAIREAQELLAALGYAPGPADGKWGQRSIMAYRSFLGDAGMEPSDVLTPEALRAMREKARAVAKVTVAPALPPDALHRVVQAGDPGALAAALKEGGDVNGRDGRGWTPLMHAANRGYIMMVPLLLEAGADTDLRAADSATALFIAAVHGNAEIVAMLTGAGADATVKGPGGRTPVDIALAKGFSLTFRDCDACPEMVVVLAGSFRMGSPTSEEGRYDFEGPVHQVTISRPFAVGKYEVTFAEWDACVAAGGCGYRPDDRGWGRGWRPVIDVSWQDAQTYVRWLSLETGRDYRLLSEAEWEYAARAGTRTRYSWGDSVDRDRANCRGCRGRWDGGWTAPVGSFPANGFGLHDMHGNVSEWVEDCWHSSYAGAPSEGSAWVTGGSCEERMHRGGSFSLQSEPMFLRSASRISYPVDFRRVDHGFRVARTLTP